LIPPDPLPAIIENPGGTAVNTTLSPGFRFWLDIVNFATWRTLAAPRRARLVIGITLTGIASRTRLQTAFAAEGIHKRGPLSFDRIFGAMAAAEIDAARNHDLQPMLPASAPLDRNE